MSYTHTSAIALTLLIALVVPFGVNVPQARADHIGACTQAELDSGQWQTQATLPASAPESAPSDYCVPISYTGGPIVGPAGPTSTAQTTTTDCSATVMYVVNFPTCLFRSFVTNTAALLIWISVWVLTFAGALFNWLVQNTIVNFGSVYTREVQDAVQSAWTAFRDVANILIIGIFTFIAISIILGLKTFGQKKLIANVLIVAVLINFSLLFTKIIIDASNFTATQIYSAAALGTVDSAGQTATGAGSAGAAATTGSSAGIGGQFIYLLGVQSLTDTKTALTNIAQAQDNGWIALFHGLFVFVILIAAAAVLFYGSFLLVSRVILIVFLMVTASVAFASYLVPKWAGSHYGWSTWWDSLIKSAVFAPVLMFFLWMTLTISWAIHGTVGSGSFGDMVANPTKVSDVGVFVNYAIILGLLFVSFKLSSVFASKISGFNFAALIPAIGAGALGGIVGFAGRQTLGRAGMYVGDKLQARAKNTENAIARQALDFGSRRFNTLGKKELNPLRNALGSAIAKTAGQGKVDAIIGKEVKGFESTQKDFLKATGEQARRLVLSDDEKKKIREQGVQKTLDESPDLKKRYDEAKKAQEEHKEFVEVLKGERATIAKEEGAKVQKEQENVTVQKAAVAGAAPETDAHRDATAKLAEARDKLAEAEKNHKNELNKQEERIKAANRVAREAGEIFQATTGEVEKLAKASGAIPDRASRSADDLAQDIASKSFTALLTKATTINTKGLEALGKKARKETSTQEKKHHLEESGVLSALKDLAKDDHGGGHDEKKGGGDHGGGAGHAEEHAPAPAPKPAAPSGGGGGSSSGGGGGGGHGH